MARAQEGSIIIIICTNDISVNQTYTLEDLHLGDHPYWFTEVCGVLQRDPGFGRVPAKIPNL